MLTSHRELQRLEYRAAIFKNLRYKGKGSYLWPPNEIIDRQTFRRHCWTQDQRPSRRCVLE